MVVGDKCSNRFMLDPGMPQESALGLIYYLCYTTPPTQDIILLSVPLYFVVLLRYISLSNN